MIERVETGGAVSWFCNTCAHDWKDAPPRVRFRSLEDFVARTGANREELATLAEIGALNSFGHHRREAGGVSSLSPLASSLSPSKSSPAGLTARSICHNASLR